MNLTGILLVCQIVASSGWLDFKQKLVIARSEAVCHEWSNNHGGYGQVAYWRAFDMSKDRDRIEFETKCGPGGTDCVSTLPTP
ncbi:hypothetical protein ACRQ5Q_24465 [Bradyrhizobium sp. PMVTL-01]|uniref:hypothetical protein n=1 Tax=Bradyrhizobium sp. PMVTL-01 TaxID=3434999 RepID=UPI003F723877